MFDDISNTVAEFFAANFINACLRLIGAILIVMVGFYLINLISKKKGVKTKFDKIDPTVESFTRSFINISLKVVVIVSAAALLGIPMTSVLAVLGSAGLAIGLAMQGGLANIAGGLIILMFKPYKLGDFIEVSGNSGTVDEIGIFYTEIVTPDNQRIVIPNGAAANTIIRNTTHEKTRRVDIILSVALDSDIDLVRKTLLDTAVEEPLSLKDPAPVVIMTEQNASSLVFQLRVWTHTGNYWPLKGALTENAKRAFDKAGIVIPYTQLDVHMK